MLLSTIFTLSVATGVTVASPGLPKSKSCSISKLELVLPPVAANVTGLAQPPPPVTAILLGVGYQNYTCSTEGKYATAGATADLFDLSCLSKKKKEFDAIEDKAYEQWIKTKRPKFDPKACSHDVPFVGHHFFQPIATGGIEPIWDLRTYLKNPAAYVGGARVAGIPSPGGSDKNVDWLQLKAVEGSLATLVYRTDTRGGVAPATCSGGLSPPIQVKYTAKYWLYGGLTL